jgi:hypothetical protein
MEHMSLLQHCMQALGGFFLLSFGATAFGLYMPWFMNTVAENDRRADEMRRLSADAYIQLATAGETEQLNGLQLPATSTTLADNAFAVRSDAEHELPAPTDSDDKLAIWFENWNNRLVVHGTTGLATAALIFLVLLAMCH